MHLVSSHWLAIEIYGKWTDDGFTDIINNFQKILACENHGFLIDYEKFYTSLLSLQLDKLVEDVHQVSFKHAKTDGTLSESIPDFYLATTIDGIPKRSLLIADFKKADFNQALVESFGYCLDVVHQSRSFDPIITIPGSMEKFCLYLCCGDESKLITIKIKEANVSNITKMKCFFFSTSICVNKTSKL